MAFSIEIIQSFEIFKPVNTDAHHPLYTGDKYSIESNDEQQGITDCYFHVSILIDSSDTPWLNGNIFLIKLLNLGRNSKTIDAYAKTIKLFMNYCEKECINYLESHSRVRSPIARYRRYLLDKSEAGELKASYIKETLTKLVMFYRYLNNDRNIRFDFCPWWSDKESIHLINMGDNTIRKIVTSSEIQQVRGSSRQSAEEATYKGFIHDSGEKLRPLDQIELEIVVKALREISNIEMTLAHQIILTTGARTQTIFTLRQCHFERQLKESELEVVIEAGIGHLVDSKNGHLFNIRMPAIIYKAVQIYIQSKRAIQRYIGAKHKFVIPSHQYVFITQQGNPFYIASNDVNRIKYRCPPTGQALTTFINVILKPKMKSFGFDNPRKRFKFHDLRATFGLLRLESLLKSMPVDLPETGRGVFIDNAISQTQRYMNHASRGTTMHYLNLRSNTDLISNANKAWSKHLEKIVGKAL